MKGNTFVSVAGEATLNTDVDKKKELWHPELDVWFEEEPESSNIALLRVLAKSAEYWDGPANRLHKRISVVRVCFTGNEDAFGENESGRFGEQSQL